MGTSKSDKINESNVDENKAKEYHDNAYSWFVAICAFIANALTSSHGSGAGLYLVEWSETFQVSRATLGWIISIQAFTTCLTGMFAGGLIDKFGGRTICICGVLIQAIGYITSTFATSIAFLYITYGIIAGIGIGIQFLVPIVVLPQYFKKHQNLSSGISLIGFSTGMWVFVPIFRMCISIYTWRGALLIHGGVSLQLLVLSNFFMSYNQRYGISNHNIQSENEKSENKGCVQSIRKILAHYDVTIFKDVCFLIMVVYSIFVSIAIDIFYKNGPLRAVSLGLSKDQASYMPFAIALTSTITRIGASFIANMNCTNIFLQYCLPVILGGVATLVSVFTTTFIQLIIMHCIYGFTLGMAGTVGVTICVQLFGVQKLGLTQSWFTAFRSVVLLFNNPFTGFLYDVTGSYDLPYIIAGCMQIFAGLIFLVNVFIHKKRTSKEIRNGKSEIIDNGDIIEPLNTNGCMDNSSLDTKKKFKQTSI